VARAREATREEELNWEGRGRRVEAIPAGGGAAAAVKQRPEVQRCRRQSRTEQDPRAGGRRREGRGPGDWFVISKKCRGLSVN
jgi:hypothetical protein